MARCCRDALVANPMREISMPHDYAKKRYYHRSINNSCLSTLLSNRGFMASTSSYPQKRSIVSPKLYDAFISYRGTDVEDTLAKELHDHLKDRLCQAFVDREETEGEDSIPSAIHNAICTSVVQIAIFSRRYAESPWCLDELVLILQQTDALFIPVFYDVQPWELRYIDNDKSQYAAAFSNYWSKGRNLDKLDKWKSSLESASNISGYEQSEHKDNLCERIVSRVLQEKEKRALLPVAKYPVGLDELVEDFERSCSKAARDRVTIVGIFGLGGSGKTTLAKELYNNKRSGYDASCFLSYVRKSHANSALPSMQTKLFYDLFHEDRKFGNTTEGIGQLEHRLRKAKHLHFLIVLDDIDHRDQVDTLLPEAMLSSDSLVIITTRDQSVLTGADIHYRMKGMNWDHAINLFSSHALGRPNLPLSPTYENLNESFVKFCGGLPLALRVLGDHLYGKNKDDWELELEKVMDTQPMDIMQSLKISFDGLDSQEKQIFIDIACFSNKKTGYLVKNVAISIWNASGWDAEHAVQTLQDRCLVELSKDDEFQMHDHVRNLGRQLADPPRLWNSEVLRSMEAKGFKQILEQTKCRCFHSFKDSTLETEISYLIGSSDDSSETELLWLELGNKEGILKSIPTWIPLQKLRYLSVSNIEELWSTFQQQMQTNTQGSFDMRILLISRSPSLQSLPDLIGKFIHLQELHILDSLEKTYIEFFLESLQKLSNLRLLSMSGGGISLSGIFNLYSPHFEGFRSSRMNSLETVQLGHLDDISILAISGKMCPRLRSLEVKYMENLKEMEIEQLERLKTLAVHKCPKLETISGLSSAAEHQVNCKRKKSMKSSQSLVPLSCLERIDIGECHQLQSIEGLDELQGLKSLVIQVPEYGDPSVWNCICGLKVLLTFSQRKTLDLCGKQLNLLRKMNSVILWQ
ncbi:disease resistance protein Roq1-like [Cryptomeria japonica]|uniref:disease resistance protein Roq1-like n=1 Tax=Cryptomeria japonica TaxID=3369 RepID=UPI0025AD8A02|nr:disease resistance protein Roq1-like [Cryptomeria japonica]